MPLIWTRTEPMVPGWYWMRGTTWPALGLRPYLREVSELQILAGPAPVSSCPTGGYEWAGPVEEPQEPAKPEVRGCSTCLHGRADDTLEPCASCSPPAWSAWQPEEVVP